VERFQRISTVSPGAYPCPVTGTEVPTGPLVTVMLTLGATGAVRVKVRDGLLPEVTPLPMKR